MRIAPLADVKSKLSAYLDECKTDGPVVITRNGKPAAVLVYPVDDEDLENIVFSRSPRLKSLLEKSRQSIRDGKGLTEEAFWQAVEGQFNEKA
jgi:prevent-host-death family protein